MSEPTNFQARWGEQPESVSYRNIYVSMICHWVVVTAILILFKPKCVTDSGKDFQTYKLSFIKILILSVGVVMFTYFYPVLKKIAFR